MHALNILKEPMDITVKNLQSSIPIPTSQIQSVAKKVAGELNRREAIGGIFADISIVFVGKQRMRSLNNKYLGHDYLTDILTFDLQVSAELVICPFVARVNA